MFDSKATMVHHGAFADSGNALTGTQESLFSVMA